MSHVGLADNSHVSKTNLLSLPVEIIERIAGNLATRQSECQTRLMQGSIGACAEIQAMACYLAVYTLMQAHRHLRDACVDALYRSATVQLFMYDSRFSGLEINVHPEKLVDYITTSHRAASIPNLAIHFGSLAQSATWAASREVAPLLEQLGEIIRHLLPISLALSGTSENHPLTALVAEHRNEDRLRRLSANWSRHDTTGSDLLEKVLHRAAPDLTDLSIAGDETIDPDFSQAASLANLRRITLLRAPLPSGEAYINSILSSASQLSHLDLTFVVGAEPSGPRQRIVRMMAGSLKSLELQSFQTYVPYSAAFAIDLSAMQSLQCLKIRYGDWDIVHALPSGLQQLELVGVGASYDNLDKIVEQLADVAWQPRLCLLTIRRAQTLPEKFRPCLAALPASRGLQVIVKGM